MKTTFKHHFTLMAAYNRRMNRQVFAASGLLSEDQLRQDCGAFFGSVFATLNHIMVGDLVWLRRFRNHPSRFNSLTATDEFPAFVSLDKIAYDDFSDLKSAREKLDGIIIKWIEAELNEPDFSHLLEYADTRGTAYRRNFAELLAHFFNHQTHHRGQVSTLLSQFGYDIGVTDFLADIPSKPI